MNMVERLERIGGLRKEEFILLKALILSNSLTLNSSSPKNGNRRDKEAEQEASVDENESECISRIENLRESLLSSLHDCVAVIR